MPHLSTLFGHEIASTELGMPVFNVGNYGAVGDGIANDTAAIRAAIAASGWPANAAAISFNPGTYLITGTITLSGNSLTSTPNLVFEGNGATIKTLIPNLTMFSVTNTIVSVTRVSFRWLTFSPNATGALCVALHNAELCEFVGCHFGGSFATGIKITGVSTYNRIVSCEFANLARGIHVNGAATYLQIIGCSFAEQLIGSPLNWIEADASVSNVIIEGCTFQGTNATLAVVRFSLANQSRIIGCNFDFCDKTAVEFGSSGSADDNTVAGCTFDSCKEHGIHLKGATRCSIIGNHFRAISTSSADTFDAIRIEQAFAAGGNNNCITMNTGSQGTPTGFLVKEGVGADFNIVIGNAAKTGAGFSLVGGNTVSANNVTN